MNFKPRDMSHAVDFSLKQCVYNKADITINRIKTCFNIKVRNLKYSSTKICLVSLLKFNFSFLKLNMNHRQNLLKYL